MLTKFWFFPPLPLLIHVPACGALCPAWVRWGSDKANPFFKFRGPPVNSRVVVGFEFTRPELSRCRPGPLRRSWCPCFWGKEPLVPRFLSLPWRSGVVPARSFSDGAFNFHFSPPWAATSFVKHVPSPSPRRSLPFQACPCVSI